MGQTAGTGAAQFRRITKTAHVCGGRACIRDLRLPVWQLVVLKKLGLSDRRILDQHPELLRADLTEAWAYAQAHHAEIHQDLRENEE